ncbi:MAG: type I-E CRISPR-associated protein Cse2/CasB [Gammaproteobacteria bacterium]|nr:type I-E CRISPR-associated protein Cse2/CasB [Gammaproteobacteria bacterium]
METVTQTNINEPDWQMLNKRLTNWQQHQRGWLAELKRAKDNESIADLPAYYRLIQGCISPGRVAERVTFLLPWLPHETDAAALGTQLKAAGISEMRLFQVLRAEYPNDLVLLRRLIQQAKPSVDWSTFGKVMQYWGKHQKRQLLQDYFLSNSPSQDKE